MSDTRKAQVIVILSYVFLQDGHKVTVECWKSKFLWKNEVLQVSMYLNHVKYIIFFTNHGRTLDISGNNLIIACICSTSDHKNMDINLGQKYTHMDML